MFIPEIKRLLAIAKEQEKKCVLLACEHSGTVSLEFQNNGCFVASKFLFLLNTVFIKLYTSHNSRPLLYLFLQVHYHGTQSDE